jgi:hypothetical protein
MQTLHRFRTARLQGTINRRLAMPTKSVALPDSSKSGALELKLHHVREVDINKDEGAVTNYHENLQCWGIAILCKLFVGSVPDNL